MVKKSEKMGVKPRISEGNGEDVMTTTKTTGTSIEDFTAMVDRNRGSRVQLRHNVIDVD